MDPHRGGVTAAVTAVYQAASRLAEEGAAKLGWEPARITAGILLGYARPPEYTR